MTTVPTWLAVLVPVLTAAVTAVLSLLGLVIKNRWDARAAARADQRTASREQAQWVRERRERAYVGLLDATRNYVRNVPFDQVGQHIQLQTNVMGGRIWPDQERSAWLGLADAVAGIQPYGSKDMRDASARLLDLVAELRERLKGPADEAIEEALKQADVGGSDLQQLGLEIRLQRLRFADLIRKELGVED
jgi:hypothetical protein